MSLRNHAAVVRFVDSARTYCGPIESPPTDREQWAESLLVALAQLYAQALLLPEPEVEEFGRAPAGLRMEQEDWQELWAALGERLGRSGAYWCYFDPSEPPDSREGPVLGDLADDLADIYRDVKPGLRAWDVGDDRCAAEVVYSWKRLGFC
jgi:hypothetical protein